MASGHVRRRGSVLAMVLVAIALLSGLLTLCMAYFSPLGDEAADSVLRTRMETEARGLLEQVTAYVRRNKPNGPLGSFDSVVIDSTSDLERLELSLPSSLSAVASGDIETTAQLYWCIFTPPSKTTSNFPPALLNDVSSGIYRQSYASSGVNSVSTVAESRGGWRITVVSRLISDDNAGMQVVRLERVMALQR